MNDYTRYALNAIPYLDPERLGEVEFSGGMDPILPTPFRIGSAAAASLAAVGLAVSDLWELRTGHRQDVGVNARRATASLRSSRYMTLNGQPAAGERNAVMGVYPAKKRALELPALQLPQPPGGRPQCAGRGGGQGRRPAGRCPVGRPGIGGGHHCRTGSRRNGPHHAGVGAASSIGGGGVAAPAGNSQDRRRAAPASCPRATGRFPAFGHWT